MRSAGYRGYSEAFKRYAISVLGPQANACAHNTLFAYLALPVICSLRNYRLLVMADDTMVRVNIIVAASIHGHAVNDREGTVNDSI